MTLSKGVVEPVFIALVFTAACLINRRRHGQADSPDDIETCRRPIDSPRLKPTPNTFFLLLSRFLSAFPFLIEIWYWNLTYWIYQGLRAVSARLIVGNEAIFASAQDHALQILSLESLLGLDIEQKFQSYIIHQQTWLMPILAKIYHSHISISVLFIVYIYTYLPPSTFQRIRRTIAVDNALAFGVVTFWRCSPPRLLPQEYGFIDVLHSNAQGTHIWTNNRFQLTIAAMPSLHLGTSLFFAVCLCRFSPHRFMRLLAPFWPITMMVTIVATANHFLIDAFVGAMVPLLGWRTDRAILVLKSIEDFISAPLANRLDLVDQDARVIPKTS